MSKTRSLKEDVLMARKTNDGRHWDRIPKWSKIEIEETGQFDIVVKYNNISYLWYAPYILENIHHA